MNTRSTVDGRDGDRQIIALSTRTATATSCLSCGHPLYLYGQGQIRELPWLPAGVKFDPSDREILEHLESKMVEGGESRLHPLIDEFIPTIEGECGICYTHPEKLPGVRRDGRVSHFFHMPSNAYAKGTRKRRKVPGGVNTDGETRWHKTGKTRRVLVDEKLKGFKKILVLYTNFGRKRKPEKTNWVMHQYHLGDGEEEKNGELVVSKVFYLTQPRQCGMKMNDDKDTEMPATASYSNGQRLIGRKRRRVALDE
ncbi:hypothetical protein SAY87_008759 [Trapa incisa]|uniref:NAC domain-containing protein n=1 Tax=Trapa incisa TaxID=236973 RepID=A0AAN7JXR1_9MYRT|nr:hypothetical protein SAY87_008759 [Trapa incisa]